MQVCLHQGATDMIIVIGRFISIADMENAYRYRLAVSADKKAHIGSTTNMKITPIFSQNFIILTKQTCEKFHFFLEYFQFSAV